MNSTNVESTDSILNDPAVRSAVYAAAKKTVAQFPTSASNPHGLDADDLASHAFEEILRSERKPGRLRKNLRQYGYPAKGEPRSLPGAVYTATAAWSRGYAGEESYNRLREKDDTYAWSWQAARDAVIAFELTSDAPAWRSVPESVMRLADQLPNLTDAELGVIERVVSGGSKKNSGRAFGELVKLEARRRAKDSRRHDGVRIHPRTTPTVEEIPSSDAVSPWMEDSEPELYGLLVDLGSRDDYDLVG